MVVRDQGYSVKTQVSDVFIREYMPSADGDFVKVYLYLLLLSQRSEDVSVAVLADRLNETESDIRRALRYWESQGLIRQEREELRLLPPEEAVPESGLHIPAGYEYPAVWKRLQEEDEDFKQFVFVTETYLKRLLSPQDIRLFTYLYDERRFSLDLMEFLVEICVDTERSDSRSLSDVGLTWDLKGIRTVEKAREYEKAHSNVNVQVLKSFGITDRQLGEKEQEYVDRWTNEYKMPVSVIAEACDCTLTTIQKPSFTYAERILADWNRAGVHTLEEARKREESHREEASRRREEVHPGTRENGKSRNRFQNYEQREINYDALLNRAGINLYGSGEA